MSIGPNINARDLLYGVQNNDSLLNPAAGRQIGSIDNELGGNASISYKSLWNKAHGTYNMGEIVVKNSTGPHLSLGIINNHVGSNANLNTEVTTWKQRQRTNMAVFKAVLDHFTDKESEDQNQAVCNLLSKDIGAVGDEDFVEFSNKHIKTAFDFLLGKDNLNEDARPLSRDEMAYLFDLLEKGADGSESLEQDVKALQNLRAFKSGQMKISPNDNRLQELVKGLKATNAGSEKRARVLQVSVNQQKAMAGRTDRVPLMRDPNNEDLSKKVDEAEKILATKMPEIGHHVLERVVAVAQKYGDDLAKANTYDVAKALCKGVMSKITAAVEKYNAKAEANGQPKTERAYIAGAVIVQMEQAVKRLLQDMGETWTKDGVKNFERILLDGLERKRIGESGFPAKLREKILLATGAPREKKVGKGPVFIGNFNPEPMPEKEKTWSQMSTRERAKFLVKKLNDDPKSFDDKLNALKEILLSTSETGDSMEILKLIAIDSGTSAENNEIAEKILEELGGAE